MNHTQDIETILTIATTHSPLRIHFSRIPLPVPPSRKVEYWRLDRTKEQLEDDDMSVGHSAAMDDNGDN
jgi:hypothetical protein